MKTVYAYICIFLAVCLCLIPLLAVKQSALPVSAKASVKSSTFKDTVKLYFPESDKTEEISLNDYLFGVLASEMPVSYHIEALKAQAVAAYTFLLFRTEQNSDKPYDITADFTTDQAYTDKQTAIANFGENAEQYTEKLQGVINEVSGIYLTYDSSIALTVYCAVSPGKTESAENVWGTYRPYLVPVDSTGDLLCKDYISTAEISFEDVCNALSSFGVPATPEEFFKNISYSDSGTVLSADFGGVTLNGTQIRSALSLRSAAFDVTATNSSFSFTVRGYGHGVGMSQYGAQYMALQGNTYNEILLHYYKGCTLSVI